MPSIFPGTLDFDFDTRQPRVYIDSRLLKVLSPEEMMNCEFLFNIHPQIYRQGRFVQEMAQDSANRYRLLLRSLDALLCQFEIMLRGVQDFLDPSTAPYMILPYLSQLVGIDFNYDMPEPEARREVQNAIYLWERKGTRDNITDWIKILTGLSVEIREYSHHVLRWDVWGQDFPENTLPEMDQHHAYDKWSSLDERFGKPPFWLEDPAKDSIYGFYGYTEGYPGYLFRNHIGIFVEVPESALTTYYFANSLFSILMQKTDRILDLIMLYGVVWHMFWKLIFIEIWDKAYLREDTILFGIGGTRCINIDAACNGRVVDVNLCFDDTTKTFDAWGQNGEHPWLFWYPAKYWIHYLDGELQTWTPDINGVMTSTEVVPIVLNPAEKFIEPWIGILPAPPPVPPDPWSIVDDVHAIGVVSSGRPYQAVRATIEYQEVMFLGMGDLPGHGDVRRLGPTSYSPTVLAHDFLTDHPGDVHDYTSEATVTEDWS